MADAPERRHKPPHAGGPDAPDDPALLRRMRDGDETALESLYARYRGLVYTLALRIVGDPGLAQEVLQDTFFRCWDGNAGYDPARGRVAWWLMGIARNRAIDVLRSRPHQGRLRERETLPGASSPGQPVQRDTSDEVSLHKAVSAALNGLPPAQRTAIELAYYGGMTQAEVATRLGEPLGTIKSRTRDGLERLRGLLWPLIRPS